MTVADAAQAPLARLDNIDTATITEASALELVKSRPEIAGRLIVALVRMNTAMLPGTVFVKREDGVTIRRSKMRVRLSESEGTLNPAGEDKDGNKKYSISMEGYRRLNELPALSVLRPKYVFVDGERKGNPYIAVDPKSKMPELVYARAVAVGYSPTGSLAATDVMIRLDMNIYLLENIQKKIKNANTPQAADAIAIYGADDEPPLDDKGVKIPGYRFMPIHSVGGLGLWLNTRGVVLQTILGDHTTRLKFAERLAQSFAERNALKAHPSIPRVLKFENGAASVEVVGWTTDFGRDEIEKLRDLIEEERLHEFRDGEGSNISVESRVETIDQEDAAAVDAEAQKAQDEETAEESGGDKKPATEGREELLALAVQAFGRLTEIMNVRKAKGVLKELGIGTLEEASNADLEKFLAKAKETEGV